MPSIATHYLFGQKLYENSDDSVKKIIRTSKGAFLLGLQGPDIFLYDIIHSMFAKDNNIGKLMHGKRTDIYFNKYIDYVREHKLYKNPTALAYFYGILCHYSLDCIAHPYVYYFTSSNDTSLSGKQTSLEAHFNMEADMDELLFQDTTGKPIHKYSRTNFMKISDKELNILSPIIAYAISETYKSDFSSRFIYKSVKRGLFFNAMLNDKYGIKKFGIKIIERLFSKNHMTSSMIFSKKLPLRSCLNDDHKEWHLPVSNKVMHESFQELFDQGLLQAQKLVQMASDMMNGKCKILTFMNSVGAMSYHTGENWRDVAQMKYFNK